MHAHTYIQNKPEDARVALVGASMGGAVSLMLSAENPEVLGK
jgi:enterochelin esterase-like enzyme